jgi:hypothetical protein
METDMDMTDIDKDTGTDTVANTEIAMDRF